MRHFCRSYEFQLPTQPSSLSPPLPPPSTVQFSTLGPGGRHVYCNIPMTLLNGQVGEKLRPLCFALLVSSIPHPHSASFFECRCCCLCACCQSLITLKIKPSFLPRGSEQIIGEQEVCLDRRKCREKIVTLYYPTCIATSFNRLGKSFQIQYSYHT